MTDSLYKGTGGHNYIQDEDNEDSFVKKMQEEAYEKAKAKVAIDKDFIDTLTAQIIRNTCEYLGEEIQDKVPVTADGKIDRDQVEDIINNITASHE